MSKKKRTTDNADLQRLLKAADVKSLLANSLMIIAKDLHAIKEKQDSLQGEETLPDDMSRRTIEYAKLLISANKEIREDDKNAIANIRTLPPSELKRLALEHNVDFPEELEAEVEIETQFKKLNP